DGTPRDLLSFPTRRSSDLDRAHRDSLYAKAAWLVLRQGSTFLKGLTTTLAYTPAARYGSASAHFCAASSDSNSATTRLPLKPAGPGSLLSMAGCGPASRRRPSSFNCSRRAR